MAADQEAAHAVRRCLILAAPLMCTADLLCGTQSPAAVTNQLTGPTEL